MIDEDGLTRDPDEIEDALKRLAVQGPLWCHVSGIEPLDLEKTRFRQFAQLARYGRQSMLQWGDVEVIEMKRHYEQLIALLELESKGSSEEDQ